MKARTGIKKLVSSRAALKGNHDEAVAYHKNRSDLRCPRVYKASGLFVLQDGSRRGGEWYLMQRFKRHFNMNKINAYREETIYLNMDITT